MGSPSLLLILSRACYFSALTLLLPMAVGLFYGESAWTYYGRIAATALLTGLLLQFIGGKRRLADRKITRREGFLGVVLAWLVMIFFGSLPFFLSGSIPAFTDAVFESASGFSTTGATILTNIEAMPYAHLFQRALAQWVGGMGIIVLSVAILPELAVGGMQLFAAESTGITTDKLSPRIVSTARRLWRLYIVLTIVLAVLLMGFGMSLFDAVTHSFTTIATAGFSTRNASIGAFNSVAIEMVTTFFMLLSGISFALLYRALVRREAKPLLESAEVRTYIGIYVFFTAMVTVNLVQFGSYPTWLAAIRAATFQTAAIITTTGFVIADFDVWPDFSRFLLVLLMFIGGCAGSTAGGVKVVRVLIVIKNAMLELKRLLHPNLVQSVTIAQRVVTTSAMQGILGFFLLYITTTAVATMGVLATGVDLITGVTAVISAMSSIGPGLHLVGPVESYAHLPTSCKWILSACMIVGRLEIYTVLVLFTRAFWKN
jgi:trk system potassium uptake protein TrkH